MYVLTYKCVGGLVTPHNLRSNPNAQCSKHELDWREHSAVWTVHTVSVKPGCSCTDDHASVCCAWEGHGRQDGEELDQQTLNTRYTLASSFLQR